VSILSITENIGYFQILANHFLENPTHLRSVAQWAWKTVKWL